MDLSIVMAFKPDKGLRDRHLAWTLERYKRMFPLAEIIVSADNSATGAAWNGFCKSKHINQGVDAAKNQNILITDIDVILNKEAILAGIAAIEQYCCILPYNVLYKLNAGSSNRVLIRKPVETMPPTPLQRQQKNIIVKNKPQGIHLIRKEDFMKMGGYDERFIGWGSEDSCFQLACRTILEKDIGYMEYDAYHLKHPIMKNRQQERDERVGHLVEKYHEALNDKEKMRAIIEERAKE